jgi:hypothetical protein
MDGPRDGVMVYERSVVCYHLRMRPNSQASGQSVVQALGETAPSERGKGLEILKVQKAAVG